MPQIPPIEYVTLLQRVNSGDATGTDLQILATHMSQVAQQAGEEVPQAQGGELYEYVWATTDIDSVSDSMRPSNGWPIGSGGTSDGLAWVSSRPTLDRTFIYLWQSRRLRDAGGGSPGDWSIPIVISDLDGFQKFLPFQLAMRYDDRNYSQPGAGSFGQYVLDVERTGPDDPFPPTGNLEEEYLRTVTRFILSNRDADGFDRRALIGINIGGQTVGIWFRPGVQARYTVAAGTRIEGSYTYYYRADGGIHEENVDAIVIKNLVFDGFYPTTDADEIGVPLAAGHQDVYFLLPNLISAAGAPGRGIESIFAVTPRLEGDYVLPTQANPSDDWGYLSGGNSAGLAWSSSAPEITADLPVLWVSTRTIIGAPAAGGAVAGEWTTPVVRSFYGEDGEAGQPGAAGDDGLGVEYVFAATEEPELPVQQYPNNEWTFDLGGTAGGRVWTDDWPETSAQKPYVWVSQRRYVADTQAGDSVSDTWTTPTLIRAVGRNGLDGVSASVDAPVIWHITGGQQYPSVNLQDVCVYFRRGNEEIGRGCVRFTLSDDDTITSANLVDTPEVSPVDDFSIVLAGLGSGTASVTVTHDESGAVVAARAYVVLGAPPVSAPECIFRLHAGQPPTPVGDNPAGWVTEAPSPTQSADVWLAKRTSSTAPWVVTLYSDRLPTPTIIRRETQIIYRLAVPVSPPETPVGEDPTGWVTERPSVTSTQAVFESRREATFINDVYSAATPWSNPVVIEGFSYWEGGGNSECLH